MPTLTRLLACSLLVLSLSAALIGAIDQGYVDIALVMEGPVRVDVRSDGQVAFIAFGAASADDPVRQLMAVHVSDGAYIGMPSTHYGHARVELSGTRLTVKAEDRTIVFSLGRRDLNVVAPSATAYRVAAIARYESPGTLAEVFGQYTGARYDPLVVRDRRQFVVESEPGGGDLCSAGGPGSNQCSISGCGATPTGCTVSCDYPTYYACCLCTPGALCRCDKPDSD